MHVNLLAQFYEMQDQEQIKKRKLNSVSSGIIQARCGLFHTIALTNAGEIIVWGSNQSGQHGIPTQEILTQFSKE
jgi:alpha-tubulin suppressor-like RCC1 family protein